TSRRTGAIIGLARDPHHLTDAAAHLQAAGIPIESCDRPGSLAPCMSESPIATAWHMPQERVVSPALLLEGFLNDAKQHQASLQTRCSVQRIITESGRAIGVDTNHGPLYADSTVLAAGAWSASLASTAGLKRPLTALRRGIFQSTAHPLSTSEHPWCWIDDVGVYVRPQDGTWLFSPCDEIPDRPSPQTDSTGETQPGHLSLVQEKLQHYLPALSGLLPARGWTGLRTFAPDRRPLLGKDPDLQGLWWAAGLGGFGVTCSYGVGEAISCWMQNRPTPWLDPGSVCPGRPQASRFLVRPVGDLHRGKLEPAHIA
ncbi:MAG: FAD-binding oxidoreductase, partial [Cyanobacteriota bacterium]|nr:FAD-binding oxidoreductase [Cyanobacteriota bacterium]